MAGKLQPRSDRFVVHLPELAGDPAGQLAALGKIESVKGSASLVLALAKGETGGASELWAAARRLVGSGVAVYPVLEDEAGRPHLPTGEITVRFQSAPTDEQLKHFADEHRLKLRDRNAYAPQQAVFLPDNPAERSLPELVEHVAQEAGVKGAWANTLSSFKRV